MQRDVFMQFSAFFLGACTFSTSIAWSEVVQEYLQKVYEHPNTNSFMNTVLKQVNQEDQEPSELQTKLIFAIILTFANVGLLLCIRKMIQTTQRKSLEEQTMQEIETDSTE